MTSDVKDTVSAVLLFSNYPKEKCDDIKSRLDQYGATSLTIEEKSFIQKRFNLLRKIMQMDTYKLF